MFGPRRRSSGRGLGSGCSDEDMSGSITRAMLGYERVHRVPGAYLRVHRPAQAV